MTATKLTFESLTKPLDERALATNAASQPNATSEAAASDSKKFTVDNATKKPSTSNNRMRLAERSFAMRSETGSWITTNRLMDSTPDLDSFKQNDKSSKT